MVAGIRLGSATRSMGIESARAALAKPVEAEGIAFEADALGTVLEKTHRYPHFLQKWGEHAWETAPQSSIRFQDVEQASTTAVAALDEGFFRVQFDRLAPAEKRYLRAMVELGRATTGGSSKGCGTRSWCPRGRCRKGAWRADGFAAPPGALHPGPNVHGSATPRARSSSGCGRGARRPWT